MRETPDSEEIIIREMKKGDYFGEMALLGYVSLSLLSLPLTPISLPLTPISPPPLPPLSPSCTHVLLSLTGTQSVLLTLLLRVPFAACVWTESKCIYLSTASLLPCLFVCSHFIKLIGQAVEKAYEQPRVSVVE